MQSLGKRAQSIMQRNLSNGIQPIGGVRASPFSSPSARRKTLNPATRRASCNKEIAVDIGSRKQ